MKKSKALILLIPFFAFLISISDVKAASVAWSSNSGGGGGAGPRGGKCASDNHCTSNSNLYLYAGTVKNVTKATAKVAWKADSTSVYFGDGSAVTELNQVHDSITASRESVCNFLEENYDAFGIHCREEVTCEEPVDYIYFSMTAGRVNIADLWNDEYMTIKETAAWMLGRQSLYNYTWPALSAGGNGFSGFFKIDGYVGTDLSNIYTIVGNQIGNSVPGASGRAKLQTIANANTGYGVAVIKLSDYGINCNACSSDELKACMDDGNTKEWCLTNECPTKSPEICPGTGIAQGGSLAQCNDDNYGTTSVFYDYITGSGTGSEHGEKETDIGGTGTGYCSLYCQEINATANLPGGFANAITLGSGIVWPTSPNTWTSEYGNMFSLSFHGTRRCYVQVAPNLTYGRMCQVDPVEDYKNALDDLKDNYNNNSNAKSSADTARGTVGKTYKSSKGYGSSYKPIDFDSVNGSVTTKYLSSTYNGSDSNNPGKSNEALRTLNWNTECWDFSNSNNDKPDDSRPANTCLDNNMWNKYKNPTNTNITGLQKAYNSQKSAFFANNKSYSATSYECYCKKDKKTGKPYDCKTCYKCESNSNGFTGHLSNKTCNFQDGDELQDSGIKSTKDALNTWKSFKSALDKKYNEFTKYVQTYRETVNIYLKLKLCSDYSKDEMSCSGSQCDYYNFVTGVNMEYEELADDGTSTVVGPLEIEQDVNYSCDRCGSELAPMKKKEYMYKKYTDMVKTETVDRFKWYINKIEDSPITMESGEVIYSLPSSVNNAYIDKKTLEVSDNIPSDANKVLTAFRNLPTSFNNKVGKKYNLVLNNITLGHMGRMSSTNSWLNIREYTCHYEVTTTNDECLCPPGTKNHGVDLFQAVLSDGLTCADAKEKYCDSDNVPECTTNCFEDKYCPGNYEIKISGCINSGKSKDWCINKLCGGGGGISYRCPSNSKNADMDITTCVEMKMSQDYSESAAKSYCERTICELDNIVIYRTIDLSNPFPSIDADATVTQGGLNTGMFNLNVKGRYPGYNWNGTQLVHNKIINNRNTTNDDVYNKKPLYHFEINNSTILRIREYNARQSRNDNGYNDFTLECIKDDNNKYVGAACLSRNFVHNPNYGGDTSGANSVCGGAGSTSSLADCLYRARGE